MTLANPKRGCGHMAEGAIYLRTDFDRNGVLPAFVRFEQPIPWPEPHYRGVQFIPGLLMRMAWPLIEVPIGHDPEAYAAEWERAIRSVYTDEQGGVALHLMETMLTPGDTELGRHIQRLVHYDRKLNGKALTESAAGLPHSRAHDLLMWVGENFYPTPESFIDEAVRLGVNKRLSLTTPPAVVPGRTALFLIHPKAITLGLDGQPLEEPIPGIIGFTYVTRCIFTEPKDKRAIPAAVQEWREQGLVEFEEIGPKLDANGKPLKGKVSEDVEEDPGKPRLPLGARFRAAVGRMTGHTQREEEETESEGTGL